MLQSPHHPCIWPRACRIRLCWWVRNRPSEWSYRYMEILSMQSSG